MEEIKSNVPVMHFCEWCYATLNEDGTCPTEDCIHNLILDVLGEENAEGEGQAYVDMEFYD